MSKPGTVTSFPYVLRKLEEIPGLLARALCEHTSQSAPSISHCLSGFKNN
jgi:hypothetical protein